MAETKSKEEPLGGQGLRETLEAQRKQVAVEHHQATGKLVYLQWGADGKPEDSGDRYWLEVEEQISQKHFCRRFFFDSLSFTKGFCRWFFFDFLPVSLIYERLVHARKSGFALWLLGIHFAAFGLALSRYEARRDAVETRLTVITAQLATDSRLTTIERAVQLQRDHRIPLDPNNVQEFWRVYISLFGEEQQNKEIIYEIGGLIAAEAVSEVGLKRANLAEAKLAFANLEGADLVFADLEKASLVGANLAFANLEAANLKEANLKEASLVGANLEDAFLVFTDLEKASLVRTNLEEADLVFANLEDANLVGANLVGANLVGANLVGANLKGANLKGANLLRANLLGANPRGANQGESELRAPNLSEAAHLCHTHLPSGIVSFRDCPDQAPDGHKEPLPYDKSP
ncbi:putative low-complexity protein [Rubidibacter lacunae KORDI 51-2]|uniref:Putative low-complexity protein n=1 Tax=Rubidibacter lacunae KORDI 51-2 TaxID=582515 RepID=U5DIK5_9CHRO|nr:pentapeptide repeat-containing protein [Rubidibacter lacunae]ERN40424.1 putative low-complexity protein [Rubidibacter lacunae KORDI 51-2]